MGLSAFDLILIGFCAVLFFRVAGMERRSGIVWALMSLAVSMLSLFVTHTHIILLQLVLFGAMWALNYFKPDPKANL
jgi:hypothetical protein